MSFRLSHRKGIDIMLSLGSLVGLGVEVAQAPFEVRSLTTSLVLLM